MLIMKTLSGGTRNEVVKREKGFEELAWLGVVVDWISKITADVA